MFHIYSTVYKLDIPVETDFNLGNTSQERTITENIYLSFPFCLLTCLCEENFICGNFKV